MRATFVDSVLQQSLERDGYVTVPFLDAADISILRTGYDRIGNAPGDPQLACHSSFHTSDKGYKVEVDRLVRETFTSHLERLFDRQRPLPCNYIVKWPGAMSGFGLHQDLSLVDERLHRSVEVWVALDDTNEQNGQLWMVPGSHAWVPTLRGIHAFPSAFSGVARQVISRHARPVPVPAGHAVVFDHAVAHFSLPNRSEQPRMVAITDLIPEEADHLHYFGDGRGNVIAYLIDDSFWTDNSPFTLWKPPPASRSVGPVRFDYHALTAEDLDRLVAEGRAIQNERSPHGAINAGRSWCHRCGAVGFGDESPDRWMGNVTLLCPDCAEAESRLAPTPAHVGP